MGVRPPDGSDVASRRRVRWAVAAALLGAIGIVPVVFAAAAVARNESAQAKRVFTTTSAQIASTLQLAIQQEADLIVDAGGFVAGRPHASDSEFVSWGESVRALDRYPELQGFGPVALVPASGLAAFGARAMADPTGPVTADGKFTVTPAGSRPFYCFLTGDVGRTPELALPVGFDLCAGDYSAVWLSARDSGRSAYLPLRAHGRTTLTVLTPVYRAGIQPTTQPTRRAAFLGWTCMGIDPAVLLSQARTDHPSVAVTMSYRRDTSNVTYQSGKIPAGAHTITTRLQNGWTVTTFGSVASAHVLAPGVALGLLVTGIALSALLAVLLFVLATGRARALQLVAERTAELRRTQADLLDAARRAGMAEIATNVLHNVGNVLNSVNVSANLVGQKVRGSKSGGLAKAVHLMRQHPDDLGDFLTTDERGRTLPDYLDKLAVALAAERQGIDVELNRLTSGVAHIKEIVSAQQSMAGVSGVVEPARLSELLNEALQIAGIEGSETAVMRHVGADPVVEVDRHRILLILVNLISNAAEAMRGNADRPRQLTLRAEVVDGAGLTITVADNGTGVPPQNLTRIFVHGFTTHAQGHGFGLHSSALAAQEMGGSLTVHSDAADTGAAFTLSVPLTRELIEA